MTDKLPTDNVPIALSSEEIKKRTAVLRRFKELLIEQRQRFRDYIDVLDKQKDVIENGRPEDILAHVELEENVAAGIVAVQKSLEPMRFLYEAVCPDTQDGDIPEISAALECLKNETFQRVKCNKDLLQKRMVLIRDELKNLRGNPFTKRKSIYAENQSAALLDISG
ncbi:MAG: flagellar biosynthesis protein FlgN [Spirochaetaceae bacterium]|jgi:hypothetical protein|nr:flagellar biosynthesis protein FlgN [Spirochaetaceae bacterium]